MQCDQFANYVSRNPSISLRNEHIRLALLKLEITKLGISVLYSVATHKVVLQSPSTEINNKQLRDNVW